jgi:hypothetical protein
MSKLTHICTSFAGRAALAAGAAFGAEGVVQLVHSQHTGSKVVGLAGHLNLAFFIVGLLCAAPPIIALATLAKRGATQQVAALVAAATVLLGLTCISSLVMGHDGSWFNVIAPLTNAAWLLGSIAIAVALVPAERIPTPLAAALPIAWIGTIPLATLGGGLITGAYFFAVSHLLSQHEIREDSTVISVA